MRRLYFEFGLHRENTNKRANNENSIITDGVLTRLLKIKATKRKLNVILMALI